MPGDHAIQNAQSEMSAPAASAPRNFSLFRGKAVEQDPGIPFEHFLAPNEHYNYLWEACLPKEGGAFISVGTFRGLNVFSSGKLSHLVLLDADPTAVAFNKVNLQLIAKAEDRWQYLSYLFTGTDRPELQKEARAGKLTYDEYLERLRTFSAKEIRRGWTDGLGVQLTEEERKAVADNNDSWLDKYMRWEMHGGLQDYAKLKIEDKTYFGNDERFSRLKRYIEEDKVTVVTGNVAGQKAMSSLNKLFREHDLKVAAVDVSNVPTYLTQEALKTMHDNIRALPLREDARMLYTGGLSYKSKEPLPWDYFAVPPSFGYRERPNQADFMFGPGNEKDQENFFVPTSAPCPEGDK